MTQKTSKKTTTFGLIAAIGFILVMGSHFLDGDPDTVVNIPKTIEAIGFVLAAFGVGVGGASSRDHDVSSLEAGLTPVRKVVQPIEPKDSDKGPRDSGLFRRVGPLLLISFLLVGCHSTDLKPVEDCLIKLRKDYNDESIVKVPDDRVRAARLIMIEANIALIKQAQK